MSRYDTTPSDDDRAQARDVLHRVTDPAMRWELAFELLGARLEGMTSADDPGDARDIARVRAFYQLYREETYG